MTTDVLKIGNIALPSRVIIAPLAGVTDAPFRRIVRRFGTEAMVTEMISAEALGQGHLQTQKMTEIDSDQFPVAIQLFGHDPDKIAKAVAFITEKRKAAWIDINMGCPVLKVTKRGGGSALMQDVERAQSIVRAAVGATDLPVTVKFRLGWDEEHKNYLDFGLRMQDAGASAVTLHARTKTQGYSGKADRDAVAALKRALDIPVIGNGDVRTPADAAEMIAQTGADGVMIGRGILGRPFLAAECTAFLAGNPVPERPPAGRILIDHLDEMEKYYGAKAIFIARKHIAWYAVGRTGGAAFREIINKTKSLDDIRSLIAEFFGV